jgi:hypothetical protein
MRRVLLVSRSKAAWQWFTQDGNPLESLNLIRCSVSRLLSHQVQYSIPELFTIIIDDRRHYRWSIIRNFNAPHSMGYSSSKKQFTLHFEGQPNERVRPLRLNYFNEISEMLCQYWLHDMIHTAKPVKHVVCVRLLFRLSRKTSERCQSRRKTQIRISFPEPSGSVGEYVSVAYALVGFCLFQNEPCNYCPPWRRKPFHTY